MHLTCRPAVTQIAYVEREVRELRKLIDDQMPSP
jgi:hypothetical protein